MINAEARARRSRSRAPSLTTQIFIGLVLGPIVLVTAGSLLRVFSTPELDH